jgi:putative mRNA 3-end processing factor
MLLQNTRRGLFCEAGNFYIDPWRPVEFAIITHGHSDHAHPDSHYYLSEASGKAILRERLGAGARIQTLDYGQTISHNGVKISLHPAGHILGSAQVRLEYEGEICVVSGDYKLANDGLCQPFEPVPCHLFVTESTFALPIFKWRPMEEIFVEINEWWRANQVQRRTSILFCYALGKAQRILRGVDAGLGPIFLHGAVERFLPAYEDAGVRFPQTTKADAETKGRGLVIAPVSADHSPWLRKFGDISTGFASGWMQMRGVRRRRAMDRGFVLSDHADWDGLLQTIKATGAEKIWVTHGYADPLARWLREGGRQAEEIETEFEEDDELGGKIETDSTLL